MKKFLSVIISLVMLFAVLSVNVCAQETDATVVSVGDTVGNLGSTVSVKISIKNNPGILAMAFCVAYDNNAFEYVGYNQGYLTNYTVTNHSDEGIVSFVSVEDSDISSDGTLLSLNFKIKLSAVEGEYPIVIKNNNPDKYDENLYNCFANSKEQYVSVIADNGVITVKESVAILGDANMDGAINNRDLALMMQYVNGMGVQISEFAADVYCDGNINNRDIALLMQYVNGWDVELGVQAANDKVDYGNQGPLVFF